MQTKAPNSPLVPAVMVHFYRGLMDVATTWRARMDSTTNWAVVSSGSIASFVLSDAEHSHIMALLGMFLAVAFLVIEARRYRFYHLWSSWLRLIETEYFGPLLGANSVPSTARWHVLLERDLDQPHFKIGWLTAVGRRLRHNYFAIFAFLLLTWATKLLLHPAAPGWGTALRTMRERAALGPIPGTVIVIMVLGFYGGLLMLMIFTPKMPGMSSETLSQRMVMRQLVHPEAQRIRYQRHTTAHAPRSNGEAPEED